ncbi:MAG: T9SS type A sorting domain-containing protein [Bacteroidia bacterium]
MKKIFTIIGLIICFNSYSQSVFYPAIAEDANHCTEFEIVVHNHFINNFLSKDLKWVRIQNTLSSPWTSAYCDCELCHSATDDSATFALAIGDTCQPSGHFYTNKSLAKNNGIMKIKVFPVNDRSKFVIGEYRATCWPASATFIENQKLVVSPNPANTILNIGFGSGEDYIISIISTDGKILVNEKVVSLTNSMDISAFNKGLYSVKIESAGKVFYSKFIKI